MHEKLVHIVDDAEEVRLSTAFVLRTAGIQSRSWSSGESFLKEANLEAAGCVILDLRMPGIDGMTVQKALVERGSSLRVIMVSGHGDAALAREALDAGALHFIEKPYDESLLIGQVRNILG